jgi:hypothetical protein
LAIPDGARLLGIIFLVLGITRSILPTGAWAAASGAPVRDFLIYYGGGRPLVASDLAILEDLDLLVVDRFRFREIQGGTWAALHRTSPALEIFIYQDGPQVAVDQDHYGVKFLNNIGRYNSGRGLAAGSIAGRHPGWVLKNIQGVPTRVTGSTEAYVLLDFGAADFRRYWLDATVSDIVRRPWKANGIFVDDCPPYRGGAVDWTADQVPEKYPDRESWNGAMNGFVAAISDGLHGTGQRLMVNRGHSRLEEGGKAWTELDHADSTPDIILEEAAFAVSFGKADVQFYPEVEWWRQVQMASRVRRSSVAYLSHAKLGIGDVGTDLQGRVVRFEDVYMFALGSYLLALRAEGPPSYFSFDSRSNGAFRSVHRLPMLDELEGIGPPRDEARISREGAGAVYRRDFAGAEVVANPGDITVEVQVTTGQRLMMNRDGVTHMESVGGSIELGPHEAAIVLRPVAMKQ